MKLLIKSAKVIAPGNPFHRQTVDVLINNGKIAEIASSISASADKEISFDNLHISPGWFDSSVSFGEPGYEERETLQNGLRTAARSGFTAIALNPDNYPVTDHQGAVDFLIHKSSRAATKLYPIGSLTMEGKGEALAELYDMQLSGAVAFGDYKKAIRNPNLLKLAFQYARGFDGLLMTFANEESLSFHGMMHEGAVSTGLGLRGMPVLAEKIQLARDLAILEYAGGRLHIPTVSSAESVDMIAEAKEKGLNVSCSVAVHNLFFTDESLQEFDTVFKVNPPLRTEIHRQKLIEAVKNGVIDMVTSDHRPMDVEHKKVELEQAKFGSLGLESSFGALNKIFGTEKSIELLTGGRKRFGIDRPGLKEGAAAELTFFDPDMEYVFGESNILSQSKNSMYVGAELKGKVLGVFSNNQLILNEA